MRAVVWFPCFPELIGRKPQIADFIGISICGIADMGHGPVDPSKGEMVIICRGQPFSL